MANNNGVGVKILGKDYQVACPVDQTHSLLDAALLLDNKMKHIRAAGRTIGVERIAVMAALNLAHELLSIQQAAAATDERLAHLCAKIDDLAVTTG